MTNAFWEFQVTWVLGHWEKEWCYHVLGPGALLAVLVDLGGATDPATRALMREVGDRIVVRDVGLAKVHWPFQVKRHMAVERHCADAITAALDRWAKAKRER